MRLTPLTVKVVEALSVVTPGVDGLLNEIEQLPFVVVQVAGDGNDPGPLTMENVTVVPFGAFTKPH